MVFDYPLFVKQREIKKGEKNIKSLEMKQMKTMGELQAILEQTKEKISRRQEWLNSLEDLLTEEEQSLQELQAEYINIIQKSLDTTSRQKNRIAEEKVQMEAKRAEIEAQQQAAAENSEANYVPLNSYYPQEAKFRIESESIPELKVKWFTVPNKNFSL